MLYEAATGTVPQGAFSPPSRLDPRFARAFDELVMRLLHPDPAHRTASAGEARAALASLEARPRLKILATRTAVAAALAFVALVAALGGWTALRRGGASPRDDLAGSTKVQANSRTELAAPVAGAVAPPNLQAMVKQSLDQSPDLGPGLVPSNDANIAPAKKKAVPPKYRVDVKLSKAGSMSKVATKSRPSKAVAPSFPDTDESLQLRRK